ncbi:hypothetical protein [Leifsonia sp. Leaf264]|uniref:hypothetical protein n=1 Tax=Leifsonia sp. Leaf264 TaxID=1736314 RepID=UPI0006F9AA12|nr:hypothetical protein [Leifsonia sp. Leaf264]KQO98617.1 hypothetical protein ASF30_11180 [Leifsonia sp. Leaf264]
MPETRAAEHSELPELPYLTGPKVEWGVILDDVGSTDIFDTEHEARTAQLDGGQLVKITTEPVID